MTQKSRHGRNSKSITNQSPKSIKPVRAEKNGGSPRKNPGGKKTSKPFSTKRAAVCGIAVATAFSGLEVQVFAASFSSNPVFQGVANQSEGLFLGNTQTASAQEVIVVDTALADWQALAKSANPGSKVVLLKPGQSGIAQIVAALRGLNNIKALHIFSHGGDGYIRLGDEALSTRNLQQHSVELSAIRQSLAPGADILLYGCEVAKDEVGQAFVEELAIVTGATVAASNNITGQHGDWDLEFKTGDMQVSGLTVPTYSYDLADYLVTSLSDTGAGTLRNILATAVGNNTADTIRFDPSLFTGGAQTITLASALPIMGTGASDDLTIIGPGADLLTISGNNATRVLVAEGTANAASITLSDMTLANGFDSGSGYAGALRINNAGNVNLDHLIVKDSAGYAGGVNIYASNGNVSISNSSIVNNTGGVGFGVGGISVFVGSGKTAAISNSTISGNVGRGNYGGGVSVGGSDSTAIISISNTTISGNKISRASSAVGIGGGIVLSSGTPTLTNVTITGNKVYGATYGNSGGGLAVFGSVKVTLNNSIVFGNTGDTTIYTTGNRRLGPGQDIYLRNNTDGTTPFNRYGLFGSNNVVGSIGSNVSAPSGATPSSTETGRNFLTGTISTDPGLGALSYNGGFVKTHSVGSGSSAANAGLSNGATVADVAITASDFTVSGATVHRLGISGTGTGFTVAGVSTTDGRGYAKIGSVDIGAYEVTSGGSGTFDFVGTQFPVSQSVSFPVSANLTMDFGQALTAVSAKNFIIYNNDGSVFETIPVTDSRITFSTGYSGVSNSKITINPTGTLATNSTYYVLIDSGAFTDADGNTFSGLTANTNWRFATGTTIAAPIVPATITSATYNVSSHVLTVTGADLTNGGAVDETLLTLTGEGGVTYTLTDPGSVNTVTASSTTQFSVTLNSTDQAAVEQMFNKVGTSSTGGTVYNLAATSGWTSSGSADATNGITVSNVATPTITSATYNFSTGVLTVTGTGMTKRSGAANDIDVTKLTLSGDSSAYTLTSDTTSVEITSATSFTVTLGSTDKAAVATRLNQNGTTSAGSVTYNLAAASGWAVGFGTGAADLTGNGITVSAVNAVPVIANLNGDSSTFERSSSEYIDLNADATVSDSDSANFNGGYYLISRTSGTADGNFYLDGVVTKSGTSVGTADAILAAGETVYVDVGGSNFQAIGTVDATKTGQAGADLRIDFNTANATPTNVSTLPINMKYGSDTNGARVFNLVINDGLGSSTASSFTMTGTDTTIPVISSVSIPNTAMKVGDTVTATITVPSDTDTYTLGVGSTIGGFTLGSLSKTNNTTYTATFTITNGGTDVAAGSNIPVSLVLKDSSNNSSATYTTAISQASDPIDANRPTVTSIVRQTPATSSTNATSVTWRVTFNEGVSNVVAGSFTVTGSTATVTNVSSAGGNAYDVTVSGGNIASTNGTVTLSFSGGQSVADTAGNGLTATTPTGTNNNTYTLDTTAPTFSSVAPIDNGYLTTSSTLDYTLSETLASGSITFTRTGGSADGASPHTCTLQGTALSSGAQSIPLTSNANGCTTSMNIIDGAIYTLTFNGVDAVGNNATTFTRTGVTADFTAPTVDATTPIAASDVDSSSDYSQNDTITLKFSEPVLASNVTIANLTISGGHTLGVSAAIAGVSPSGGYTDTYTITVGSTPSIVSGDTLTITAGNVVDRAGNPATASKVFTAPGFGPTITAANISLSGATGTGGAYRIGDTVTATWNNTAGGDNNTGVTGATANFSQFGGGTAVTMTNSSETWTASYTLVAGAIDTTNRNVTVTASNAIAPSSTAGTSNATVDNIAPTVTAANISVSGASGPSGAFIPGDTVTVAWNNTAGGDNNSDTISSVAIDFSAVGGGTSVTASNTTNTWSASYTLLSTAPVGSNLNVIVKATDNAGNLTSRTGTNNLSIVNVPATPVITGTSGDAQATLSFATPANNGSALTGYTVAITGAATQNLVLLGATASTNVTGGGITATISAVSGGNTEITLTGLSNGSTYNVTVTAKNAVGLGSASNSAALNPVRTSTPAPTPNPNTSFIVTVPTDLPQTRVTDSGTVVNNAPLGTTVSDNGVIVLPKPTTSGGQTVQTPVEIKSTTPTNAVLQLPAGTPVTFSVGGQMLTLTPTPPAPPKRGQPAPAVVPVQVQTKTVTVTDANGNTQTFVALQVIQGTATLSGPAGQVLSAFSGTASSGCSQSGGIIKPLTTDTQVNASAADPQWLLLGHIDSGAITINFDNCGSGNGSTSGGGNGFAAASREVIVYRGEQAYINKAAQIANIVVRSATGLVGDAGDPLTITGLAGFRYAASTFIPQLAKDTGRLPAGSTLQSLLGAIPETTGVNASVLRNQDSLGALRYTRGNLETVVALPVGEVRVEPGRADSVVTADSGQAIVTVKETIITFNALPRDPARLVSDLQALDKTADLSVVEDGSLRLSLQGKQLYALQPAWSAYYDSSYLGTPRFIDDPQNNTGVCHNADGWRQCYYPVVNNFVDLQTLVKKFDPNGSVRASRVGLVTVTLQGKAYTILPDWAVFSTPAAHANDDFWVDGNGRFYVRNSDGLAQGFVVR